MYIPYTIQPGDTYLRICVRHGINLPALFAYNPQLDPDQYALPGHVLMLPARPYDTYSVQPYDTLCRIAARHGVPEAVLRSVNPSLAPDRLTAGQRVFIPYVCTNETLRKKAEYGPGQLMADLQQLSRRYSCVQVETIGQSVLGKPILAVSIGRGNVPVHANGGVHANEWVTSALLMQFIEDYARACDNGKSWLGWDARSAYERTVLKIVPMVNPDGIELVQEGISPRHPYYSSVLEWNQGSRRFQRWKANIRGVDLNDQFPAHWEEERARRGMRSPAPLNYGGEHPLSEPEAAALASYTERNSFELALSFHTQGQEIYWNYRDYEPPEAVTWAERFESVSGYRAVKLSGSDAGYKDWFIQRFRKPGFTVEVGLGASPLPLQDFDGMYKEVSAILREALNGQVQE
ncbi:M14 family metallopeptidase [Paenibacillus dendritiformis]|uniref:M14 family metallopeptidase n=1 Tax=Paenibacillus dendritiformis TaxID=130049 RepID=UPI0036506FD6